MKKQNLQLNSPQDIIVNDREHNRQTQKLLFTHVTSFIQMGHKGEDEIFNDDESINQTENPLNTSEHSEILRKSFKRSPSPRNPQKSSQQNPCIHNPNIQPFINLQSSDQNKQQYFNDKEQQHNYIPSIIQDKMAQYSYNGINKNFECPPITLAQSILNINHQNNLQNNSNAINNDKKLNKLKEDDSQKNKNINPKNILQLIKAPSISDFAKPNSKKRMTEILKNGIIEPNSAKALNDFEKGNKIIMKVLKNSMDRMQRIELHLKGFIYKTLNNSWIRHSSHLSNEAWQLIQDKSYIYKQKQKQHSKFIIFLNQLLKKTNNWSLLKVFMPTSSYRLLWDAIQVCFTILFLYFYSILVFFGQDYNKKSDGLNYYFQFAFYLFLGDMLVNFNTAFFNKDTIVLDRNLIAKKYIKSQFFTDSLCLIMLSLKTIFNYDHVTHNPNHEFLIYLKNILIFFKIFGLKQKIHMLQSVSALNDTQKYMLRLFTQIILVILAAHIVSILWYSLALFENSQDIEITWIKKLNIEHELWYCKYIYSLYWSVTTMTTVGYGDISATNDKEALFVTIVMIFMSCVFAYSINNIGIILQTIERDTQELTDNVTTIQRYLNRKCVNVELKSRIRHYLYFLAEEQKDRNKEIEDKVLGKLSNKLREEVTKEVNSRVLKKYMIFTKQFSSETINRIVQIMKEVLISPNEIIFKENEVDDSALYLIENGIVEIQHTNEGIDSMPVVVKTLGTNQLFGEISLFSGLARSATARSVNLSTLFKIKRSDLIDVLKQNEEDFERFKMINEQIIYQKDFSSLGLECYTCHKQGHISSKCYLTHLQRDRQFVALRDSFSISQKRVKQLRNKKKIYFQIVTKIEFEKLKNKIFSDLTESDDSDTTNNDRQEDDFQTSSSSDDSSGSSQNDSNNKITKSNDKKMTLTVQSDFKIGDEERKKSTAIIDEQQILRRKHRLLSKLEQMAQCLENKLPQQDNNVQTSAENVQIYKNNQNRKSEKYEALEKSVHFQNKDKENIEHEQSQKKLSIQIPQYLLESESTNYTIYSNESQRKNSKRSTQLRKSVVKKGSIFADTAKSCDKDDQKTQKQIKERESIFNMLESKATNVVSQNVQLTDEKTFNYYQSHNQNNYMHYAHNLMNGQSFKQFNDKEKFDQFEYFDSYKEYSKFFPYNNISKVLDKMKIQIQVHKKSKLKSPPKILAGRVGPDTKAIRAIRKMNLFILDDIRRNGNISQNPTSISYGIGQKGQNPVYPIRKL